MDGVHDLGGMDGFGPVPIEHDEPVFHHPWEGRVWAINAATVARGVWNIDIGRFGIESLSPQIYVSSTYYELWLARLERMLVQFGVITAEELASGHGEVRQVADTFTAATADRVLARGSYVRTTTSAPRFAAGDTVRASNIHPRSHTRLPRYVRGHLGVVERIHAPNAFPDSIVRGDGEDPQWLYTVCFDGHELWGEDSEPGVVVSVDAFEPYLEPA